MPVTICGINTLQNGEDRHTEVTVSSWPHLSSSLSFTEKNEARQSPFLIPHLLCPSCSVSFLILRKMSPRPCQNPVISSLSLLHSFLRIIPSCHHAHLLPLNSEECLFPLVLCETLLGQALSSPPFLHPLACSLPASPQIWLLWSSP